MSAETQIQTIIDNAIAKASDLIDEAKGYSEAAQTAAASYVSFNPPSMGTWTTTPVPAFEPDEDLSALFRSEFDNAYNKYLNLISDKIANFLVAYFPDVSVALQTAERWLVNTINNGGTGLPVDVENAIWERNRAKELVEAQRMEDVAVAAVAAKGFSLPTGALSARLLQVQQAASDKVSTQARDVAIKQAEIELGIRCTD